jgi:hypothetical protein
MALAAAKELPSVVSVAVVPCDVRSDIVRATSVTLRLIATPDENSTNPKNIIIMTGTMTANSVAAIPLQSCDSRSAERRARTHIFEIDFIALP